jgi:[acyl-carrier-protein] S-malonyltransferase
MKEKCAFLFPGQGAQFVGMGKDFYEQFESAKAIIEHAQTLLGFDLKKIIFSGPAETLVETRYSQVAIFVISMALLAVIKELVPEIRPHFVAGLSLGEYSALCAAGFISFEEGLKLVQKRSELMHKACDEIKGGLCVVLGLDEEDVKEVVENVNLPDELWMANLNCPKQVVISGTLKGLEEGKKMALKKGAKKVIPLQVHGAFHSGLMQEAEKELNFHLDKVLFKEGTVPIVMNTTGCLVSDKEEVLNHLRHQMTSPVFWQKGIETMDGEKVELYIEIGCGKVLSGLNRKIGVSGKSINIEKVDDLKGLRIEANCE